MTGFTIGCPSCKREYLLPQSLMGMRGARVRCPVCSKRFDVDADGQVCEAAEESTPQEIATTAPLERSLGGTQTAATSPAEAHARAALDALVAKVGPGLFEAASQQRLFREHGPALLEAFDDYRRRAGSGAPPEAFGAELRERFGIDLLPAAEAR